jgi:adenylate cyclase class 2
MCTEIEAKLKVDSLTEIENKLEELGAEFQAEQLQADYFFDDANAVLTKSDRCLRLRKEAVGKSERYLLTYKGAKEKSRLKKRREIEISIKDADSLRKILSGLGYEKVLEVKKRRLLWQFNQCKVALDRLPLLGDFVEIEGPDEEQISAVQENLGLSDLQPITKSYASLITERLQ